MARKRVCRGCGCTEEDCRRCIQKTGSPCSWFEEDLCSACAGYVERRGPIPMHLRDDKHPERFAACQSKHRGGCWGRVEECYRCDKRRCFAEGTTSLSELCDYCWGLVADSKAYWPTLEAAELQAERISEKEEARRLAAVQGQQAAKLGRAMPAKVPYRVIFRWRGRGTKSTIQKVIKAGSRAAAWDEGNRRAFGTYFWVERVDELPAAKKQHERGHHHAR